eukprot:TRINITY_DN3496_c2_g3_i1.p1 TRINITY_DN3496_c2_g3~~TRINITY_DN3496_c2_g3_i1.p1  ORF type:complete len:317 (-),score=83.80 TRINITY_DN3496_c2_g3_i1:37-987(-)
MQERKYICRASQLVFDTMEEYQEHLRSDHYRFNLKRKVVGLPPLSPEQWVDLQESKLEEEQVKSLDHVKEKNKEKVLRKREESKLKEKEPQQEPEDSVDLEKLIEEQIAGKEPIPTNVCLFDDHVSKDFNANMKYMRDNYGFVIPERDSCINQEGLVEYLGEKIGIGNFSIWNDKHFQSKESCQKHMRDTGTCRMQWEDNEDEYSDFYDFTEYNERAELLANNAQVSENGYELVLTNNEDIRILGHRELALYYKQYHRETSRQLIITAEEKREMKRYQKSVNWDKKQQRRHMRTMWQQERLTGNRQRYFRDKNPII